MLPYQTSLLVLAALISFTSAVPVPSPEITITHTNATSGEVITQDVDADLVNPQLAQVLRGNKVNVNIITDKKAKRSHASRPSFLNRRALQSRSGIDNSTINLTVISRRANTTVIALPTNTSITSTETTSHHNVDIDASASGGAGGGIHGSTFNINFNGASNSKRSDTTVGTNSVHLDMTTTPGSTDTSGISASTVHINILPARADSTIAARADNTIGDSSILIKSSAGDGLDSTSAGNHSAIVDTSSSSSNLSKGITGSTINLTVVSPKKETAADAPAARAKKTTRRVISRLGKRRPVVALGSTADAPTGAVNVAKRSVDTQWVKRINDSHFVAGAVEKRGVSTAAAAAAAALKLKTKVVNTKLTVRLPTQVQANL